MGNLYIVSTPIGNLQDITLRAAGILLDSRVIVAESTSKAGIMLNYLRKTLPETATKIRGSTPKIISLTEDEEENKIPQIMSLLEISDIALISEAGTPLISDPGFRLVRESIKRGINVVSIPGPTSPITALTASGLPTDKFLFLGYLPKKTSKLNEAIDLIKTIKQSNITVILFESPHRLIETLETLRSSLGDINIVIARELTKIHEELRREKIFEAIVHFTKNQPKGEFVILF